MHLTTSLTARTARRIDALRQRLRMARDVYRLLRSMGHGVRVALQRAWSVIR